NAAINQSTTKYNELIIQRNAMLQHSTEKNPMVENLNAQIDEVRNAIKNGLNNYKTTTQLAVNKIQNQGNKIGGKINAFPNQEKVFKDISRQQQIVEAIYLFLLQKREETEISNAATPSKIKIVDSAY